MSDDRRQRQRADERRAIRFMLMKVALFMAIPALAAFLAVALTFPIG